MSGDILFDMFR